MGGKQKVVVRVQYCCDKTRSKALQTVAGVPGLLSVSLEGAEKERMVVIGEEIDSYELIKSLKKKVGCVELLTVGPVEEPPPPPPPPPPCKPPPPPPPPCKCLCQSVPCVCHPCTPPPPPPPPCKCLCQSVPCVCQTVLRLCPQERAIYYVCESCNPGPSCVIM